MGEVAVKYLVSELVRCVETHLTDSALGHPTEILAAAVEFGIAQ